MSETCGRLHIATTNTTLGLASSLNAFARIRHIELRNTLESLFQEYLLSIAARFAIPEVRVPLLRTALLFSC